MMFVIRAAADSQCVGRPFVDDRGMTTRGTTLRLGAVRYDGKVVTCAARQATALVSTVERRDACPPLRFVQWCSLRGLGVCDEGCLLAPTRRR
jgi:hypothetical protein